MLRVFTDLGLRRGEVLGLHRRDLDGAVLELRGSAREAAGLDVTASTHR